MAKVTLIHPQQRVEVSGRTLVQKIDLFADDLTLLNSPYTLKSRVSLGAFEDFVAALEDEAVTITNDNMSGLSRRGDEFRFRDLATAVTISRLSGFSGPDSATVGVGGSDGRLEPIVRRVALPLSAVEPVTAPAEMSRVQESAVETLLWRMARLETEIAEPVTTSALTQLQNDLKKLKDSMKPLHEDVSALKEWAQKSTPHSTQQSTSPSTPPQSAAPAHTPPFHFSPSGNTEDFRKGQ
jgi:hypothetical protein